MIGGHSVSGVVITLNEERNIRDCIESMKWADEIIVVDSFSKDATVEIARQYTDKVIERPFEGFVDQIDFALSRATCEWVLWLDADERLTPEALAEVTAAFEPPGGPDCDGFAFPRKTWFLDRWITHSGWYPQHKLRLFRREGAEIVGEEPHPKARVPGPTRRLGGDILHLSYPGGMAQLAERSARYASLAAVARYARGKRFSLLSLLSRPPFAAFKRYVLQLGVLDGLPGLAIAVGAGYYRFLREVKLWELAHAPDGMPPGDSEA